MCLSTFVISPVQRSGGLKFADRPGGTLHLVFVFSLTFFSAVLVMEGICPFETLLPIYQITLHDVTENC